MDLYFVRHGRTEWNQELRFQGREGDSPLLPESYLEIGQLGQHLADIPFSRIYASPQKRARETAEGIQKKLHQPVAICYAEGLKELGMGILEGADIKAACAEYGQSLENLRDRIDKYDPIAFAGEPYEEMLVRSIKVVTSAVASEVGPLLFVSHGSTLTGCIQTLAGANLKEIRKMGGLGNNTLSLLKTNSKNESYELALWNDRHYLT